MYNLDIDAFDVNGTLSMNCVEGNVSVEDGFGKIFFANGTIYIGNVSCGLCFWWRGCSLIFIDIILTNVRAYALSYLSHLMCY